MPTLESIQSGAETIAAADGTSHDVTITSVTAANCIVLFTVRSNDNLTRYLRHLFRASVTGATTLNFARGSSSFATDCILEWTVYEFAAGEFQSIQSGSQDCTADPTNVTISAVTVADSIPIFNGITTDQNTFSNDEHNATAAITSTTNLQFDFAAAPGASDHVVGWQVLEFNSDDVTIQSGTIALDGDVEGVEATDTATITAVDTTKTFVNHCGVRMHGAALTLGNAARRMIRAYLSNSTTVHAQRSTAGTTPALTIQYDVVEFDDHTDVESGLSTISDTGTSVNPTFTQLGADSGVWPSIIIGNATNPNNVDPGALYDYQASIALSSPPDDVVLARIGTDEDLQIAWYVCDFTTTAISVDFPLAEGSPIILASSSYAPAAKNNLGTRTDDFSSFFTNSGYYLQSVKFDFGTQWARQWETTICLAVFAAPAAYNGHYRFYLGFSGSATAGQDNPAGLSGAYGYYYGYGAAFADAAEAVQQLLPVAAVTVSADDVSHVHHGQIFVPRNRYGILVMANHHATSTDTSNLHPAVRFKPLIDQQV